MTDGPGANSRTKNQTKEFPFPRAHERYSHKEGKVAAPTGRPLTSTIQKPPPHIPYPMAFIGHYARPESASACGQKFLSGERSFCSAQLFTLTSHANANGCVDINMNSSCLGSHQSLASSCNSDAPELLNELEESLTGRGLQDSIYPSSRREDLLDIMILKRKIYESFDY